MKLNTEQRNILIDARQSKKLSQEALSFELNISQSIYSRIERGVYNMKDNHKQILCRVLDIKL